MLVLTMAVIGLALCANPMDYWTPPKKKLIEAPFREKTIAVRVQYTQKQLSEIFGFPAV